MPNAEDANCELQVAESHDTYVDWKNICKRSLEKFQ